MNFLRAGLLLALSAGGVPAADFESWHNFEVSTHLGERTELLLHSQLRTHSRFTGIGQFRVGPVVYHSLQPHLRLIGGYYYRDVESSRTDWHNYHRIFAGMENPFALRKGKISLEFRTLAEHCHGWTSAPYNRLRQRVLVRWNRRVSPYWAVEPLVRSDGLQIMRYSTGVQRRLTARTRLEVSYYYEDDKITPDRHILVTGLRFDLGKPR